MHSLKKNEILLLFDVDGTLTSPRSQITQDIEDFLYKEIKPLATIGVVSGSDLEKILEQLNGVKCLDEFNFVFPENGLVHIENGKEYSKQSILQYLGEEKLSMFINYVLSYLSKINLPFKRGTFIEYRNGMINISPVGRQCSPEERNLFNKYDNINQIRQKMIEDLKIKFSDIGLTYSIGGQISFDVFPHGWDKSYCLNHVKVHNYKEIHFFGDKTEPNGNDYEIYTNSGVIGHTVTSPDDTKEILTKIFNLNKNSTN